MAELTAGAAKYVLERFVDLEEGGPSYPIDLMTHEERSGQDGDMIKIPSLNGSLTVFADGSTDQTPDDPSVQELQLIVDLEPMILIQLRRRYEKQMLGGRGRWSDELGAQARIKLKNYLSEELFDYLLEGPMWDASGTYWYNGSTTTTADAGDTLTYADFLAAKAKLMGLRGASGNYQFWIDSYAEASVQNFPNFVGNNQQIQTTPSGEVGVRMIGVIAGIPVYVSSELPGSEARGKKSVAFSASTVTSGVYVFTVAAGHGIVPGMRVGSSGATNNITTSGGAAVSAVTATTITTVADGSATDASNGAGTLTMESGVQMLIDAGHVHVAGIREAPALDIVKREKSTGYNLQLSPLWGRIARAGRQLGIISPRASLTF